MARTKLKDITFTVFDIETTGFDAKVDGLLEIGAVKVRNGRIIGTFQVLVDPEAPISYFHTELTGIDEDMVAGCPKVTEALIAFLTFAEGSVLVAHNARFDTGFLSKKSVQCGVVWTDARVLDTLHIAQRLVDYDETDDHRLASLAALFSPDGNPNHRALADAQATVDVLHSLFRRLGSKRVWTLERLDEWMAMTPKFKKPKAVEVPQMLDPRVNYNLHLVPF